MHTIETVNAMFNWLFASASVRLILGNCSLLLSQFFDMPIRDTDALPQILLFSGIAMFAFRFFVWLATSPDLEKLEFDERKTAYGLKVSIIQHGWPFLFWIIIFFIIDFALFYVVIPNTIRRWS